MSYSIKLVDSNGITVPVERHSEGANQVIGGSTAAEIDITYNYSWYFYRHLDAELGIRWLYDKRAGRCVIVLNAAIVALGTEQDGDYWCKSPGNAGYALSVLRRWAIDNPDAMFRGD